MSLDELFGNAKQAPPKPDPLESLFGNAAPSKETPLDGLFSADASGIHFCRDCSNFIPHPYVCRCGRSGNPVSPTDDCTDFVPAKPVTPAEDAEKETDAPEE